MKRKKYFNLGILLFLSIILVGYLNIEMKQDKIEQPKVVLNNQVYKIGVYDFTPFYEVSETGVVSGFYDEVLKLIQRDFKFNYEYVIDTFDNLLNALEEGELDLIFGVQHTKKLDESFIFSHTALSDGHYVLYGDENLNFLQEPVKIALIEGDYNNELALRFLNFEGVSYTEVKTKNLAESQQLLNQNQVDLMVTPLFKGANENQIIYHFSAGPQYIMGHQNMVKFMELIDSYTKNSFKFQQQLEKLKVIYLNDNDLLADIKAIMILMMGLFMLIGIIVGFPRFNQFLIRRKITYRLRNQQYLIYYQPIIDPKTNQVKGLEALLRLDHPKRGVLSPYYFMDEIMKSSSLKEVSRWILKKVIIDFQIIKHYQMHNPIFNSNFYVSINITAQELEDEEFVNEIKQYLLGANLPHHSICLELAEGTKIENMERVKHSIECLKEVGARFAIDDFGVDYSNLNVLDKIKYDFIKVDKNFIDNFETSDVNRAIIEFISNFTNERDISIVFEGVETKEQVDFINKTINMNSYIQGYYYARPLSLELIKFYGV